MKIAAVLRKNQLYLPIITNKKPYLADHHQRISGRVLSVNFNKKNTTFELSDFRKTSKKLRSNVVEIEIRDIFQYTFVGICIAHKKDQYLINTSFLIRNTFDRTPYELHVKLYSPIIENIGVLYDIKKLLHVSHSKYYYLRSKSMPESTIFFDYITDLYDHKVIHEDDSMLKEVENSGLNITSPSSIEL
jgi:ribosomal protein L19